MITLDTSTLMAILLHEPAATACVQALANDPDLNISAGTLTECLIVATKRGRCGAMLRLIEELAPEVLPVTEASARLAGEAYANWGKGNHAAGLNFGDCFAYVAASAHGGRLLFIGNDLAKTDLESVL